MPSPSINVVNADTIIAIIKPVYEPNRSTIIIGPSIIGATYAKICKSGVFVSKYSVELNSINPRSRIRFIIKSVQNIAIVRG